MVEGWCKSHDGVVLPWSLPAKRLRRPRQSQMFASVCRL